MYFRDPPHHEIHDSKEAVTAHKLFQSEYQAPVS